MRGTPETDAFMTRIRGIDGDKHWVPANTARRLERERDEARAELSLKCQSVTIASGTISDLLKKSERLEKQIEGLNNFANERFDEIQRVRRERDEARAVLERIVKLSINARRVEEDYAEWEKAVLAILDICEERKEK